MSKKILIITDVCFGKKSGAGNRTAVVALVKNLSKRNSVDILNINRKKPVEFLPCDNVNLFRINNFYAAFYRRLKDRILKIFRIDQDMYSYVESGYTKKKVIQFMNGRKYDFIIVEYIHLHYLFDVLVDKCKCIICDTHDVFFQRAISYKENSVSIPTIFKTTQSDEIERLDKYNYILAIQEDEAKVLSQYIDKNKIITVSRQSEIASVKIVNSLADKINLGILGNKADFNIDAAFFFCEKILPKINKSNIRLIVAGGICKYFPDNIPGVEIKKMGYVDNLSDFYCRINLLVNPVRFGSGLKTKNIEAMQYGRPVLTTEIGAQGLKEYLNRGVFVFNDHKEFERIIDDFFYNNIYFSSVVNEVFSISKNELTEDRCFHEINKIIDDYES